MSDAKKPDPKQPEPTQPVPEHEVGMVKAMLPGVGYVPAFKCRAVLPAKTQVPGVGVVNYMDGHWFPSKGVAFVKAPGSRGTIVHPAQALISIL